MLLETEQATARWLAAMGDEELMGTVVRELRLMFPGAPSPVSSLIPPNPEPKPKPKPKPNPDTNPDPNPDPHPHQVSWVIARLGNETYQRGAFTYVPPFTDEALQRGLHLPWAEGRIMLAGEHTSCLHMGTMHGALVSGRQAAEHVLAAQQGRGVDATSWWRTSYTDRYMERLRTVLEGGGESPEEGEDEYTWDRNP